MIELPDTFRVLKPYPNVFAFYDGRELGRRLYSPEPNWVDDGAYELGIASYAIVSGSEALVYDTHMSLAHARAVRSALEAVGVTQFRVVLSHWHDDHIAGSEVFSDCGILSNALTAKILAEKREQIEAGNPPIKPLILPNATFEGRMTLHVGDIAVELIHFDIHSPDETLMLMGDILFGGDAVEDTCTYVSEPERLGAHLADLDRLKTLNFRKILPNHGDPAIIEAGGYGPGLIDATQTYVRALLALTPGDDRAALTLKDFIADDLEAGRALYFAPYEAVHRRNVEQVLALQAEAAE